MSNILLIDGNHLAWRWYMANQNSQFRTDSGIYTTVLYGQLRSALKTYNDLAGKVALTIFVWDKGESWRKTIDGKYKEDRKQFYEAERPKVFQQINLTKSFFKSIKIAQLSVNHLEGDDCLGLLANDYEKAGYDVIISSGDKDLYQLLSKKISIHDGKKGVYVTLDSFKKEMGIEPEHWILVKALSGKKGEVPGVKGIGEKTALKIIKACDGNIDDLLNSLEKLTKGIRKKFENVTTDELLLNYKLSKILTNSDNLGIYQKPYEEEVNKLSEVVQGNRRIKLKQFVDLLRLYDFNSLTNKTRELSLAFQLELV